MTLIIDLPPDAERRLVGEASGRGLGAAEYAARLLSNHLETVAATRSALRGKTPFHMIATNEEWERSFREWVASHTTSTNPVSLESLRREHLYDNRGL